MKIRTAAKIASNPYCTTYQFTKAYHLVCRQSYKHYSRMYRKHAGDGDKGKMQEFRKRLTDPHLFVNSMFYFHNKIV